MFLDPEATQDCAESEDRGNCLGGDNQTESESSRTKAQMRRQNLLGKVVPIISMYHVTQLAIRYRYRLKNPGLDAVLEAFKQYRTRLARWT